MEINQYYTSIRFPKLPGGQNNQRHSHELRYGRLSHSQVCQSFHGVLLHEEEAGRSESPEPTSEHLLPGPCLFGIQYAL